MTQFQKSILKPGCQVMWTGVSRDRVQQWADKRGLQTLSSAMGPLMDSKHSSCRRRSKTEKAWKQYVMGASALFAMHLPKGCVVTLITKPPPSRINSAGDSTYQLLEQPMLQGIHGGTSVLRIEAVHFEVAGMEDFRYQVWPVDEVESWVKKASSLSQILLYSCPSISKY